MPVPGGDRAAQVHRDGVGDGADVQRQADGGGDVVGEPGAHERGQPGRAGHDGGGGAGLAGLPNMEMMWGNTGNGNGPGGDGNPACTPSSGCLANPAMQTVSNLPGGTSAPNTVITEYAVSKYHLQPSLNGWLIQAPAPLTATQINAAQHLALAYGVTVGTKSDNPDLGKFADGATALGIVIAFGLLGAILGMAGALVVRVAWAHSSLSAMFGDLPLNDMLILLIGLPLAAAAGGWLLAGREPEAIARQPLD